MTLKKESADYLVEGKKGDDLVGFVQRVYTMAKRHKADRKAKVQENIQNLQKIDGLSEVIDNYAGRLAKNKKSQRFYSPVLATTVEKKAASAWIPRITFEPEEATEVDGDLYRARNTQTIHDFMLRVGGFYEQKIALSYDLYTAGRCFLYKGWQTREEENELERAEYMKFKALRWKNVYWTKDKHNYVVLSDYTPDELVYEFGEEVMKMDIDFGKPFDDEKRDDNKVDFNRNENQKKVGVVILFNDVQKTFTVIMGSNKQVFKNLSGAAYPWIGEKEKGFIPVDAFDASNVMTDGEDHPLCDIDKIVDIWKSYSFTMNTTLRRIEQAARSRRIIGVDGNPEEERNKWIQSESDWAKGYDVPYFMKAEGAGASKLFAQQMEFNPNLNSVIALREAFYDEIMIATGINYRALGQGAPTAEQERLRVQRELDVIDELIELNAPNWAKFARTNIQMLRNVDADFVEEHVMLEDEFSDDPDTFGAKAEGVVSDVVNELDEFRFNVKVSINNSSSKRKSVDRFQKQEALNTLSGVFGVTPGTSKIAKDFASDVYPNLIFADEDFQQPVPEQGEVVA